MALGLLTISCNKGMLLGLPTEEGEDDSDEGNDPPTEVLLPVEGNNTYSSGHIVQGDYAPARPIDGFATIAEAVK